MVPLEPRRFRWAFTLLREGLLFLSAFTMAPLMEIMLGKGWSARFTDAAGAVAASARLVPSSSAGAVHDAGAERV